MEIILAIIVASAVIFFGALISMGNERQRKAIDSLREQMILWAMQDLRIKRGKLAREIRVDAPLNWFNNIVTNLFGYDLNIHVIEFFDEPNTLVCDSDDGNTRVLFSEFSPDEIRKLKLIRRSKLGHYTSGNPLLFLPRKVVIFEVSVLNSGILFDLELPLAWKGLTGQTVEQMERIWIYTYLSE